MIADLSPQVALWWGLMSLAGVINIALWLWLRPRGDDTNAEDLKGVLRYRLWHWILAGGFALGCASRSWVIRADVQRIAMLDTPFASVAVGRSIATVAETMFVAQWALLLNMLARHSGSRTTRVLSWLLVPIILIAETCSWSAVLTTNYLGNVYEESLWAVTGTLFVVGLVASWRRAHSGARPYVSAAIALGILYVLFMVTVDVPMYITRWHADTLAGKPYFDLAAGWLDATRVVVTGRFEDWRDEMPWMSLYFSSAVWMSLAMVRLPRFPGHSPSSATPD